ncbi:sigma factor [Nocardia sp. NPDC051052]|uniref:sigma factor n=1 Tax=Nocardia sp. NPDC051052 TaxID=3364322 RepID=UPI00378B31AA
MERRHPRPLCRFATGLIGNSDHADDIVLETPAPLWQRRSLLDEPVTALRAWLSTVTRTPRDPPRDRDA